MTKIIILQVFRKAVNTLGAMVGQRKAAKKTRMKKIKKTVNPLSLLANVRVNRRAMNETAKKSVKGLQLRMSRGKDLDVRAH